MKNSRYYITAMLYKFLIISILWSMWACSSDNQTANDYTRQAAEEDNNAKYNYINKVKDAQFLVNAAEINLEQIRLGQLAQQYSMMKEVKELGKILEEHHNKSMKALTLIAKKKAIAIPTSPTDNVQDAYKTLRDKSGSNFDKSYSDLMVVEHKNAVAIFEKAATDSNDADIKAWAKTTLPDLSAHLDLALACQKKNQSIK